MAPTPEELSAPGSVSYSSDTMTVGDGTWSFSKNTFLFPNLVSPNFETMRYNGMGNRFSTLTQYHSIVKAHAVMGALIFLLIIPVSVMIARFYSRNPGYAVVYHAQLNIVAGMMLLAVFILGYFAVGPERSLSNPHHGIGVAIFVLFILQLIGGRLVRHILKARSLRIMIHQWSGRSIALLGIVQVPLGLTLYGSPRYLFILYTLWMTFLLVVYFILSYRKAGRRDTHITGGRSEAGRTRVTESEYLSDHKPNHSSKLKWLGPLAAGAGLWALLRKKKDRNRERSRSPSYRRSEPEVIPSRRGSASYYDEKYSEAPQRRASGGGFFKYLAGAAAAVGAGKLASNFMKHRENQRHDEYSAVSTETPRRYRSGRSAPARSDYSSEYIEDPRRDPTQASLIAGSAVPSAITHTTRDAGHSERPTTPGASYRDPSRRDIEDSEYSSYVSPSRRTPPQKSGGFAKGILGGLGMGWIASKFANRRSKREEDRLRKEEDMRAGTHGARFTGDGFPSPTRRESRRPPPIRRQTGYGPDSAISELTESTIQSEPLDSSLHSASMPPATSGHGRSRSRHSIDPVSMPPMPADSHGVLHSENDSSFVSSVADRPQRRESSRRRSAADRAAADAAARASSLAADEQRSRMSRDRYASPGGQPVSVKVKVHDDRDRNVTLRRLTEEEAMASRDRRDSESSLSGLESPSQGRGYRRGTSQQRAERAAERRAEDRLAPLSPPNPAFARGRRAKDSAYYSGQPGPSGGTPGAGHTVSSLGSESHGTWSGMSQSPTGPDRGSEAAADNRRRRRQERRRASSSRPTGADMFE